jgi:hypothetical protein
MPAGQRLAAEAGVVFDQELDRWLGSAARPERTLRQFAATLARLRAAYEDMQVQDSA